MKRPKFVGILCLLGMVLFSHTAFSAVTIGDIAPDFTLVDYVSGQPVSLYDFEGHIIVIDFFAYWCNPCKAASKVLEPGIQQYYDLRGGNPDGIPVILLSLSIDHMQPDVDDYIEECGLDIALNDSARSVYNLYKMENSIPQFKIINGVDSEDYDKWEVIHEQVGYSVSTFRSKINSVKATRIPGDANRDGRVDGSDVTILSNHWQHTYYITWEDGDFNGDGKVDGSDVTILANHWQEGVSTTATAAVPEPSTLMLLTLGFGTLLACRFAKRRG